MGLYRGWRFEASDESSAAPKLNWRHVYQLFGPHNCIVVILARKPAVPTQLAIVINCHNAIMLHVYVLKETGARRAMKNCPVW